MLGISQWKKRSKTLIIRRAGSACLVFLFALFIFCTTQSAQLKKIRVGSHPTFTRIVFDFDQKPQFEAPRNLETPDYLELFFPSDGLIESATQPAEGLVATYHVQKARKKILFRFKEPSKIKNSFLIAANAEMPTYRYVIDIEKGPIEIGPVSPVPDKAPPPPPIEKRIIIIDAGHGGIDTGAVSRSKKIQEKTITLSVAKLLSEKLNKTGNYNCILTRDKDAFLKLGQRLKKAHTLKGDLFISLHADSNPQSDVRGLAVYTLSAVASDREAARLAKKENEADLLGPASDESEDPEVANILIDLVKRETMNLSTLLARSLTKKAGEQVFLLRKPHRFADFYVLRSPKIPSVLVELGYISNREDEKLLSSSHHQDKICEGLLEGINTYFKEHYA
ncbi:MAG: N-acetylmuramoyl-L-alanine amidase [Alphaproteobacteria bacterium]